MMLGRITCLIVIPMSTMLAFVAGVLVTPTYAQEKCPPNASPSIAFVSEEPITATVEVSDNNQAQDVVVNVHNSDPKDPRFVDLSLNEVFPSSGRTADTAQPIEAAEPVTAKEVEPLKTEPLTLPLIPENLTADTSYDGTLVATDNCGDLASRKVVLQVVDAEPPAPDPQDYAALNDMPNLLSELTIVGTNFVPSLLSPLRPALLWFGIAFLLTALLWSKQEFPTTPEPEPSHVASWVRGLVGGSGVVLLIAWVTLLAVGLQVPPGNEVAPRKVIINDVPVSAGNENSQPTFGYLGLVESPQGSIGKVVLVERTQEDTSISVQGILRAGAYKGNLDLDRATDEGKLPVVVNVSDHWLWAVITIALGVLLGYWLTQYYGQKRPAKELRARAQDQIDRLNDKRARKFLREHRWWQSTDYSIRQLVEEWTCRAERDLLPPSNDVAAAKARIDRLKAYIDLFEQFREDVARLHDLRDKVCNQEVRKLKEAFENAVKTRPFGLDETNIDSIRAADQVIKGEEFSFPTEDEQGTKLKARQKMVQDTTSWLTSLNETLLVINHYLEEVGSLPNLKDPQKVVPEAKTRFARIGREALMADKKDDLGAVSKKADDAWLEYVNEQPKEQPKVRHFQDQDGNVPWLDNAYQDFSTPIQVTVNPEVPPDSAPGRYQQLLSNLRLTDLQMTLLAGALAVGSGFYALYYASPAWGTPKDYLYAILWGSVISEGLKYVGNLAGRVWPSK